MKNPKIGTFIIYLLFALVLMILGISFFRSSDSASRSGEDPAPGVSYVAAQDSRDAASAQARIRQARQEAESLSDTSSAPTTPAAPATMEGTTARPEESAPLPAETTSPMETTPDPGESILAALKEQVASLNVRLFDHGEELAAWRKRFDHVVITGDSMAQGLVSFDLFDENHVKFKLGASLGKFDEQIQAAIDTLPDVFIFFTSCGNVTEYINDPTEFYRQYVTRIEWIQSALPETEIYVICMLPASDNFIKYENYHVARQPEYDAQLKMACEDTGVHYVDCHWIVRQELYLDDGLHFGEAFYTILIQYLALVIGL